MHKTHGGKAKATKQGLGFHVAIIISKRSLGEYLPSRDFAITP